MYHYIATLHLIYACPVLLLITHVYPVLLFFNGTFQYTIRTSNARIVIFLEYILSKLILMPRY